MKNRATQIIIGVILTISGAMIKNTMDENIDFKLPNGVDTVFVANPLPKHPYKTYTKRDLESINSIDIHHTATDTLTHVEFINKFIVEERDWEKLPYHFLIDYTGAYYFNNPLDVKTYHNSKNNSKGVGVALIGNFSKYKANDEMICRLEALIKGLDSVFDIKSVNGHRDWKNTACPGDSLYGQLKEWNILKNNKHYGLE